MLLNKRTQSSKRQVQVDVEAFLPWTKKMKVELGTETESEKHLKELLEKQLCTTYSMKEHLERQRLFTKAGSFTTIPTEMTGTRSTQEIQDLQKLQEYTLHLRCCGLTHQEIHFYLSPPTKNSNMMADPEITKQTVERIEAKIRLYEASQSKSESGSGLKLLGRHQMDLERSLYNGCAEKESLKQLVGLQTVSSEEPYRFIAQLAKSLTGKKKKKEISVEEEIKSDETRQKDVDAVKPDPSVWHAMVPLDVEEIEKNRLTLEEIRQMPRFKDYLAGSPSKVLYVKNLHPRVHVGQLVALFGRFDASDKPVTYRLLTGRLRGQAFATFKDTETAISALQLVNGYKLNGRPVIVQFGRNTG